MRKARLIFNRHCLSPLLRKGITATYSLRHIHCDIFTGVYTLLCPDEILRLVREQGDQLRRLSERIDKPEVI